MTGCRMKILMLSLPFMVRDLIVPEVLSRDSPRYPKISLHEALKMSPAGREESHNEMHKAAPKPRRTEERKNRRREGEKEKSRLRG